MDKINFTDIKKVLLVAASHVGTNLFCTPAIRLLKKHQPHLQLDIVAMNKKSVGVFLNNTDIDNILCIRRTAKLKKLVHQYDFIIGLHEEITVKFLKDITVPHVIHHQDEISRQLHRVQGHLRFMQRLLGCELMEEDANYIIPVTNEDKQQILKLLPNSQAKHLVGLHLGSGRTAIHGWKFWYAKRASDKRIWPLEHYIAFAKQLIAAEPNIQIVLTGSRNEKFLAKRFKKEVPQVLDLIGATSLQTLTALMKHLSLYITQDTGALHVATAAKTPLIALFGPTFPALTGPFPLQNYHTILKKDCVTEIMPEEVCAAALQVLDTQNERI